MEDYQMHFDVRLESDRELEENVATAVEFAHEQVKIQYEGQMVMNRHEGYGILSQNFAELTATQKAIKTGMADVLGSLKIDENAAINAISSLDNSLTAMILAAVKMSAQAKRINEDLYHLAGEFRTPLEELMDDENDGFEEAEENNDEEGNNDEEE